VPNVVQCNTEKRERDSGGRFTHKRAPPKRRSWEAPPCPKALQGVQGLWDRLASRSLRETKWIPVLIRLYERYAHVSDGADVILARHYHGVPHAAARLLLLIDSDVDNVLRRYASGLPCSDVETVIALTLRGLRPGELPGRASRSVLADITVALVRELEEGGHLVPNVPRIAVNVRRDHPELDAPLPGDEPARNVESGGPNNVRDVDDAAHEPQGEVST